MLTVTFRYINKIFRFKYSNGYIETPVGISKLGANAYLYVIENNSTDRSVYIGATTNIVKRIDQRARAIRELGIAKEQIEKIDIRIVEVEIEGHPTSLNKNGISTYFYSDDDTSDDDTSDDMDDDTSDDMKLDVEWILIRMYIASLFKNTRNMSKANKEYVNETGDDLLLCIYDNIPRGEGEINIILKNGKKL